MLDSVRSLSSQFAPPAPTLDIEGAMALGQALVANVKKVMLGAPDAVLAAAVAVLSGGHLLIEDVPGVGKTVLARAIAVSLGSEMSRVQGHADLLPSDVTGVSIFSPDTKKWEFHRGPVFARVVLFDELNRTPPRTQSALLETMEEHQVTVDGQSWPLPRPHFVVGTQNPLSQRGTYPLVESQLDRFSMSTSIGYPAIEDETNLVLQESGRFALEDLQPICTAEAWTQAQALTETVTVDQTVARYAVELCRATRRRPEVRLGVSPRAAIWLVRSARAHALLAGRTFTTPGDIKAVAIGALAHRILLQESDSGSDLAGNLVKELLETTPSPRP
jgi:MoxR-like ATPase